MRYTILFLLVMFIGGITTRSIAQPRQSSPEQRTEQLKEALKLSDDQVQQVLVINKEMDNEWKALMESESGDRQAMREVIRGLAEKTDLKIEELLTDGQKETYQRIKKERRERVREFRNR